MEQRKTNFDKLLAFGAEGEKDVATKLIELGCTVLPLYQFEPNKTPILISKYSNSISPDLTVFNKGKCFFIEVKTKNNWIEYKGIRETGCDFKHYSEYKKLSNQTETPLFLIFNHMDKDPKGMFYVDINKEGRFWNGKTPSGKKVSVEMYFWNYKDLNEL